MAEFSELSNQLKANLKAAVLAEPSLAEAVAGRWDAVIADWCNAPSAVDAWRYSVDSRGLFDATDILKFNNLTAINQAAWTRFEAYAPHDFGVAKNRKFVQDVWGGTEGAAILPLLLEKASNAQAAIGGQSESLLGVSGIDRKFTGRVNHEHVSALLSAA